MSGPATETPSMADGAYAAVLHTDLASVAPLWRRLQGEGASTAYQHLAWTGSLVRHLAPERGAVPLFVAVTAAGSPVMLLPLALSRRRGVTVIEALDLGVCDYAAPLLAHDFVPTLADAEAVWRVVRAVLPAADLVRITRMPATLDGRANPLALLAGTRRIDLTRSGFVLEGEAETLLRRVCTPSAFKDLARRSRRFDEHRDVRFVAADEPEDIAAIFTVMIAQRRARFHELGRHEPLDRDGLVAFYRAALTEPGSHARVFGLRAEGEWIATAYGLVHRGAFHGVMLTMAGDAWRSVAPGLLIAARIMVWAREQGLDYFDFTIGTQPYKNGFRPVVQPLFERAEAITWRGRLFLGSVWAAASAKARLERRPALFARLRTGVRLLRRLKQPQSTDRS